MRENGLYRVDGYERATALWTDGHSDGRSATPLSGGLVTGAQLAPLQL